MTQDFEPVFRPENRRIESVKSRCTPPRSICKHALTSSVFVEKKAKAWLWQFNFLSLQKLGLNLNQ